MALFLSALCAASLLLATPGATPAAGPYQEDLVERTSSLAIDRERPWRVLLHYRPVLFRGTLSLVDDPAFFLSPRGKHDPAAELAATVRGLFSDASLGDAHPRCRFPARFEWLRDRLGIDERRLPQPACGELEKYLSTVAPQRAALVFPVGHMNSPASMFGHTLIRIDAAYESALLSYAVNYAARVNDTLGLTYAFKGIFGLYPGYYSILPYYEKITEYGRMENRDIWEYTLALNPAEVRRLALHIWELRDIYSDYFFFDENCSYNILFLIEAARPEADLTDGFPPWVIPVDTIRAVAAAGLVADVAYRPSQATTLTRLARDLTPALRTEAAALSDGASIPAAAAAREDLGDAGKALLLDTAVAHLQYRYSSRTVGREEYLERFMGLLNARSAFPATDRTVPRPVPPEEGHASARLALGGGFGRGEETVRLRLRPVYHDLLDPDGGFVPGAAISFADVELRFAPRRERLGLWRLSLLEITSLSARNELFSPTSWRVRAGLVRLPGPEPDPPLVFAVHTAGGWARGLGAGALAYALAGPEVRAGGGLEGSFSAGMRLAAGLLGPAGRRWKLHAGGGGAWFGIGDRSEDLFLSLGGRFSLGRNLALTAVFERHRTGGDRWSDTGVFLQSYF